MRWFFLLLLAMNLVFAGYVYLRESAPNPDAQLFRLQMNADQISVLPPRQAPAETAAPAQSAAAGKPACLDWGSFGPEQQTRARAALDSLGFGERAQERQVSVDARFWVHMPPMRTRQEMERKTRELNQLGVSDHFEVLEPGRWRYSISLGAFRSEEGARAYLEQLRGQGVRSAVLGERQQRLTQTAYILLEPTVEESVRLVQLQGSFPGSELKAVECPRS